MIIQESSLSNSGLQKVGRRFFHEANGFDAEIEAQITTTPTETKNISEYKDVVQKKTFALVYEVEYDGKSYKLLNPKK